MSVQGYIDKFLRLNVAAARGSRSPHKVCMLLAVLDLARSGALLCNEIRYTPALLERYRQYFDAVRGPSDHPNPWFPFFHLQGRLRGGEKSFWHLRALPGREAALESLDSARSARAITDNVDYAWLDDDLYALLTDPIAADELAASLAREWFSRDFSDLGAVVARGREIGNYEKAIRNLELGRADVREVPVAVRNPAFRRVVTEVYDYRCAATGTRLVLPDGRAMVEAAHIHPFSESRDDDPRNGLALTPDMHWAMDENLIAPTPDFRWRVSQALDKRIPENQFLVRLDGEPLLLPQEKRWWPRQDVLEWRLGQLLSPM